MITVCRGDMFFLGLGGVFAAGAAGTGYTGCRDALLINELSNEEIINTESLTTYNTVRTLAASSSHIAFLFAAYYAGMKMASRKTPYSHPRIGLGCFAFVTVYATGIPLSIFSGAMAGKYAVEKKEGKSINMYKVTLFELVNFHGVKALPFYDRYLKDKV